MALCYVNGAFLDDGDAVLSVLDHGLVVGDGAFETVLLAHGRPFALRRHLERLERSATGLGLAPPDLDEVRRAVTGVADASGFPLGRIRITYTAGRGPLGSGRIDGPPTVVVAAAPDDPSPTACAVAVVPWRRNERGALAGLKTTSYAENVRALEAAHGRGSDEAIFANTRDELCEGTGSNVFVVRGGLVATPPLDSGCLAGVTRALVLERSAAVEETVPIGAFRAGELDEAFLTSSLRGVQAIASIDGVELGAAPGPVTASIAAAYDELVATDPEP